jgi:hypothetical protein
MKANSNYFNLSKARKNNRDRSQLNAVKTNAYTKLTAFLHALAASLLRGNELQVEQRRDRRGNTWWQAFDPTTNESVSFGSEAEMRAWIEQRYYR